MRHLPTSPLFPYTTLFRSDLLIPSPSDWSKLLDMSGHQIRLDDRFRAVAADVGATSERSGGRLYGLYSTAKKRSEEHTSELQSRGHLVCRLLLEKKKNIYM